MWSHWDGWSYVGAHSAATIGPGIVDLSDTDLKIVPSMITKRRSGQQMLKRACVVVLKRVTRRGSVFITADGLLMDGSVMRKPYEDKTAKPWKGNIHVQEFEARCVQYYKDNYADKFSGERYGEEVVKTLVHACENAVKCHEWVSRLIARTGMWGPMADCSHCSHSSQCSQCSHRLYYSQGSQVTHCSHCSRCSHRSQCHIVRNPEPRNPEPNLDPLQNPLGPFGIPAAAANRCYLAIAIADAIAIAIAIAIILLLIH